MATDEDDAGPRYLDEPDDPLNPPQYKPFHDRERGEPAAPPVTATPPEAVADDIQDPATAPLPLVEPAEPPGRVPVGTLPRAVAMTLDMIVLVLASLPLSIVGTGAVEVAGEILGAPIADGDELAAAFVGSGFFAMIGAYFAVLHADGGQTIGKAILGIKVTDLDGHGIPLGRSAIRTAAYLFSLLPFGLGFLLAGAPAKRALHDYIAGSAVFRVEASL